MPRERRVSVALGLVLGFLLAVLVLGLLGAFGVFELVVATLLFSLPLIYFLRPAVRRFLAPRQGSQGG